MPASAIARFLRSTIADLERDIDLIDDLLAQGDGHDRRVRLLAYAGTATSIAFGSKAASFASKSRSIRAKPSPPAFAR